VKSPNSRIETIGTVELVDFPELSIQDVPAKVDTGADNSAIWASDIMLEEGVLSFTVFGQGSRYYTGNKIQTKNFRTTSVKNSFGHAEFRYKVSFLVAIGNRRIRTWFTLSDRSGMTYPVLIGRKLLRNKYVVDVSKHSIHGGRASKKSVLILSSKAEDLEPFFADVKKRMETQATIVVRGYKDLAFRIAPNKVKVFETKTGKDISDFDLVYFKSHKANSSKALAAAEYLQFRNVKFFDKELLSHISYDKLSEYVRLALYNLSVPRTVCGTPKYLSEQAEALGISMGWPLICKEINEDRGRKNFLAANPTQLKKILKQAGKGETYLVQKYVPNDGYVRALVFGRQVSVAVRRETTLHQNSQKQHLNNPPGSVNAKLIPDAQLDSLAHDLAIRAAEIMNRQVAGVDLIQHSKTKKWYLLEANNAPQLKGGSFVQQKEKALANFIDFELNR
jgi:glutathione synthase/RimK-type ligase-like ATP-grasp enzyme